MAKVFASIGGAFGYATKNTFKKPVVWFLVALVLLLEVVAACVGTLYLSAAIFGAEIQAAITGVFTMAGLSPLLNLFPAGNTGALIAVGVVGLVISLFLLFFILGLQVKIYAGKDVTFSGFFGTVGRGVQNFVITLIYQIVVVIIFFLVSLGMGKIAALASGNVPGMVIALGAWAALLIALSFFFTIFMIPALVNFSRQGKFAAAFHFKEIGAMIGATKWYKILLGIIIMAIIATIMILVLALIGGFIGLIPGIAGAILSTIFLVLAYVYVFFLWSGYWAKLIENKA